MTSLLFRVVAPVVAVLGLLGAGYYKGVTSTTQKFELQMAEQRLAHLAQVEAMNKELNRLSAEFEKAQKQRRIVYRDRVQTVEKIVEKPVYRTTECFDADGLRVLTDAIRGGDATGTGEPAGAVRPPAAAQ